jgi:hypothetical protein
MIMIALVVSVTASFAVPGETIAQTTTPDPQAARENGTIVESASSAESTLLRSLDATPTAPAAKGRNNRVLSENEAYNLGRAAEGRVGLRLGSDMSFRVEKRASTP